MSDADSASIRTYTAFCGDKLLVSGPLEAMLRRTKDHLDAGGEPVLVFEDRTGAEVDFDFRGSAEQVLARAAPAPARGSGPGRPRLGVVCREVSLLPRHWDWLAEQPNGISATLRRLVDQARKHEPDKARAQQIRDAVSRVMWALCGNREGFEEASRALFARDKARFAALVRCWPDDIRAHLLARVDEADRLEGPAEG